MHGEKLKDLLSYIPNNAVTYTSITLTVGTALYVGRSVQTTNFRSGDEDSIYLRYVDNTTNIHTHNQHQLSLLFNVFPNS
jgi:hypothetical protein